MNKLFIIACSHGMGCEIEGEGIGHFTEYNLKHCYGTLVAEHLNLEPVNLSWPGGSNDRIFRVIYELVNDEFEFFGNKYKWEEGDRFLIQWTGPDRIELKTPDGYQNFSVGMGFKGINPDGSKFNVTKKNQKFYDQYIEFIAQPDYTNVLKTKNILGAKELLDSKNIKYYMTESDRTVYNDCFIIKVPYWEYLVEKGYKRTPAEHFGKDAHKDWANKIIEAIKKEGH